MIDDKDTNVVYFSDLLRTNVKFTTTYKQLTSILNSHNITYKFLPETKDIWVRDYMPIQINRNSFLEYRYDPNYLQGDKKGFRDLKSYPDIICDAISLRTKKSNIILDGGNVVKSSNCIILTDKVVKENKYSYNKTELMDELRKTFKVDKVILIPWDTLEKYGHSDGMLRFIDNDTVLINGLYRSDDNFMQRLLKPLKHNGLNWEWLSFNVKKKNKRNWAYINFLQTKDIILVPKLKINEDDQALDQIKKFYPDYSRIDRVMRVDMRKIVEYGGALNCITWTVKN